MTHSDRKGRKPTPTPTAIPLHAAAGNELFEKAVAAIALDELTTRWLLVSVLRTIGARPQTLTPDELGVLLPEVDRRLRQLTQPEQADRGMACLRRALMGWQESG
jgi:hypothetical protein